MKSYQKYKDQVKLLLLVLPIVGKQKMFALHGGTAINLFHFDMPRLSVDIDLTYILVEERVNSLNNINNGLKAIKVEINKTYPRLMVDHKAKETKLFISDKKALVKLKVN